MEAACSFANRIASQISGVIAMPAAWSHTYIGLREAIKPVMFMVNVNSVRNLIQIFGLWIRDEILKDLMIVSRHA